MMLNKFWVTLLILTFAGIEVGAQNNVVYTKSFTRKLAYHQIDFFQPVERWIHITNIKSDGYMNYDAVLRDEEGLEIRLNIQEANKTHSQHPHIELMRIISTISTNNQEAQIKISQMNQDWVKERYQADWGLFADFIPKVEYSEYPKGRLLCLFKEGQAMVNYIVLHDEEELDPYFEFPLAFY